MKYVIYFLAHLATASNPPPAPLDAQQMFCAATAVYHEARGESQSGKVAVAFSIKNRIRAGEHPATPCEVVYQTNQYTDIRKARPDYNSKAWRDSVEAAVFVFAGYITDDPTKGARFYYNPKKAEKPSWTEVKILAKIGNHLFWDKRDG